MPIYVEYNVFSFILISVYLLFIRRSLTFGSAVEVTGVLKRSPHPRQPVELEAHHINVVGKCNPVVDAFLFMKTNSLLEIELGS